jgi:hypothetical protein
MLKTNTGKALAVTELTWNEVVDIIAITNPNVADVMYKLQENVDYKFYKASYRFGDKIISRGKCYLPLLDGGTISFEDPELPDQLRGDLFYSKETEEDPLGLMLNKTSEFYLPSSDGVQPHSIINPGSMIGIPKATDEDKSETSTSVLELDLNAGSRSLFMLSKISDKTHHVRLQKHYGITLSTPSSLQEHWELFVDISNKADFSWRCEVLYFPRAWINKLKSDEWALLAKRLLSLHRSTYTIRHRASDAWDKAFSEIDHQKRLTDYAQQSRAVARQLFTIAANAMPGFKPAVNDNSAPISQLTKVYNEVYNKIDEEKNSAVIMETALLNKDDGCPIYYSINYSPFSQENLQASNKRSHIGLLEDIRRIVEYYHNAILDTKDSVQSLYNTAQHTSFSFYHSDPAGYPKIYSAKQLPEEDKRFTENQIGDFPGSSSFFRGCVKISYKE